MYGKKVMCQVKGRWNLGKTPPAGGGGTKVPEGEWVASRSDDGRSFFYLPDRSSLPGLHIPVAFCLGG